MQVLQCMNMQCKQFFILGQPQTNKNDVLFFICTHCQAQNAAVIELNSSPTVPVFKLTGILPT